MALIISLQHPCIAYKHIIQMRLILSTNIREIWHIDLLLMDLWSIHYVFASVTEIARAWFCAVAKKSLELINPITNDLNTLRTSLLPALLDSIKRNENFGFKNIALFEIGSVYDCKRNKYQTRLCRKWV